jgi:hypothetical protein
MRHSRPLVALLFLLPLLPASSRAAGSLIPLDIVFESHVQFETRQPYNHASAVVVENASRVEESNGDVTDLLERSAHLQQSASHASGASYSSNSFATFESSHRQGGEQSAEHFRFSSDYAMSTTLDSSIRVSPGSKFFYIIHAESLVVTNLFRSLRLTPHQPVRIRLEFGGGTTGMDFRTMRPVLVFGPSPYSPQYETIEAFFSLSNENYHRISGINPFLESGTADGIHYLIEGSGGDDGLALDITLTPDGTEMPWELELSWYLWRDTKFTHGPFTTGTRSASFSANLALHESVEVWLVPEPSAFVLCCTGFAGILLRRKRS